MVRFCENPRSTATSSNPPWPRANTFGKPATGGDSLPSGVTTRMRPGRSVTSMRPSGRKASAQGCCRPLDHGLDLDRPGGGGNGLRRGAGTRSTGRACNDGVQAGADHQGARCRIGVICGSITDWPSGGFRGADDDAAAEHRETAVAALGCDENFRLCDSDRHDGDGNHRADSERKPGGQRERSPLAPSSRDSPKAGRIRLFLSPDASRGSGESADMTSTWCEMRAGTRPHCGEAIGEQWRFGGAGK